ADGIRRKVDAIRCEYIKYRKRGDCMKFTTDGNVIEGTPEELAKLVLIMQAEQAKEVEEESETKMRTVKRKARVGERILITNAEAPSGQYNNGDILTVSKEFGKLGSPHAIQADGVDIGIYHNEYEVIIEDKPKLEGGDLVKVLANSEDGDIKAGEVGVIQDILDDEDDPYTIVVQTEDDYDYFRPQDLELITEETTKLEVGDYVV